MTMSAWSPPDWASTRKSFRKSSVSDGVLCIFQFAAIIGLRMGGESSCGIQAVDGQSVHRRLRRTPRYACRRIRPTWPQNQVGCPAVGFRRRESEGSGETRRNFDQEGLSGAGGAL